MENINKNNMKKLLGIMVLGLLLSGNVNAKEIWLDCLFRAKAGHTGFVHSFIINEKEKTLRMNGILQIVEEFDDRFILFTNPKKYEHIPNPVYTLDRITGVYNQTYKCKVVKKTLF